MYTIMALGVTELWGICWLSETLLASQEWLLTMELIIPAFDCAYEAWKISVESWFRIQTETKRFHTTVKYSQEEY
jgi:hypothetical protein